MFKHFYGLSFNPFDKSISEKDCFISDDHKQMISRLNPCWSCNKNWLRRMPGQISYIQKEERGLSHEKTSRYPASDIMQRPYRRTQAAEQLRRKKN